MVPRREERINKLANKKIDKIEKKRGSKVENYEIIEAFSEAEKYVKAKDREKKQKQKQKRKWRNRIIAILGALGISIGGYAMLPSGETKENDIKIEENNNKEDSKTKFRDEIKIDKESEYTTPEDTINPLLIDEILEIYNSKCDTENKIDKNDLRNNITRRNGRRKYYRKYFRKWRSNIPRKCKSCR